MTQRELAAEIGVTETAIANWENGRTGMGWLSRLVRLCQVLSCQVEDLAELESDEETIKIRIAELREQRGLSQRDLGRRIGGTATTIANWERGVSGLEWIRQALALCQALNCKISDLMKISDLDGLQNIQKKDTSLVGLLKKQKNAE